MFFYYHRLFILVSKLFLFPMTFNTSKMRARQAVVNYEEIANEILKLLI